MENENSSNFRLVDVDEEDIEEDNESSSASNTGTRDRLLQSFDDVLKHLKEEREQEQSLLPNLSIPTIKQKYTGHRNARTMVCLISTLIKELIFSIKLFINYLSTIYQLFINYLSTIY
jgi:hypothetical protein